MHDASAHTIRDALSALQPVNTAGFSVDVDRAGPFWGGGYRWGITLKPATTIGGEESAGHMAELPTIGVQHANLTGTGVRVKVERRDAYEAAAAQHLVSLAAPLPLVVAEVQTIGCSLRTGLTPSEAATAGVSFTLQFRGEMTVVSSTTVQGT